jgi:hypothetical protein
MTFQQRSDLLLLLKPRGINAANVSVATAKKGYDDNTTNFVLAAAE